MTTLISDNNLHIYRNGDNNINNISNNSNINIVSCSCCSAVTECYFLVMGNGDGDGDGVGDGSARKYAVVSVLYYIVGIVEVITEMMTSLVLLALTLIIVMI